MRRLLLSLALLAAAAFAGVSLFTRVIPTSKHLALRDYFGITADDEVGVVADTTRLTSLGRLFDGAVYLDYDSVSSSINPSVYYDEGAELVIITTPTEKKEVAISTGGEARYSGDTLYLSLELLQSVTDMTVETYEDPARVYVGLTWSYPTETAVKQAPVRYQAGIRSPIVAELSEGETVRVTDVDAYGAALSGKTDGWTHVVTDDGIVGYVRDKHLGSPSTHTEEHEDRGLSYTKAEMDEKINLVFHQTDNQASNDALTQSLEGVTDVNIIAPTWLFLDSTDGEMRDVTSASYVETAHEAGMQVWAVVNDFDGNAASSAETEAFVASYEARTRAISEITEALKNCGADGICLDFELVREGAAQGYLEFIRELGVETRNAGLVLSICNYVPSFTKYLGRTEQARIADYLIVMCYDEHTSGSETAGSVASLPFVESGIDATLTEVDAERLIAAIPFFTRLWTTEGSGSPTSRALGMTAAQEALDEYGMTAEWDAATGQNYAEAKTGETLYQIWLEDEASIREKMKVIRGRGLAGVAEWKLGLEDRSIWEVLSNYLS